MAEICPKYFNRAQKVCLKIWKNVTFSLETLHSSISYLNASSLWIFHLLLNETQLGGFSLTAHEKIRDNSSWVFSNEKMRTEENSTPVLCRLHNALIVASFRK